MELCNCEIKPFADNYWSNFRMIAVFISSASNKLSIFEKALVDLCFDTYWAGITYKFVHLQVFSSSLACMSSTETNILCCIWWTKTQIQYWAGENLLFWLIRKHSRVWFCLRLRRKIRRLSSQPIKFWELIWKGLSSCCKWDIYQVYVALAR